MKTGGVDAMPTYAVDTQGGRSVVWGMRSLFGNCGDRRAESEFHSIPTFRPQFFVRGSNGAA
jgi:hypothetical protein